MISYILLGIASLLPVITAMGVYLLEKRTKFGSLPKLTREIIIGVLFGGLAIVGTEWGIPMNGAQVNCRDGAVLVAGLLFGGRAGILAGLIGGVERWIAVAWGVGTFTRVACSVSTIIAGFYAAALRKFLFEDKKPGWILSLAIGVVMEVFHLSMVFLTNMQDPERAMSVVRACTAPMLAANGLSVMFAAMAVTLLARERLLPKQHQVRISQTIQRWLLVTVLIAFFSTSAFVFSLQDRIARVQADSLLSNALQEISDDLHDASDAELLSLAYKINAEPDTFGLTEIAAKPDVSPDVLELYSLVLQKIAKNYNMEEVSMINSEGIIFLSNDPTYIGFDMNSGDQPREFLRLLGGTTEFAQEYGPIQFNSDIYRKYAGIKTSYGFLQVGYAPEQFQAQIADYVKGLSENRHVGQTGFVLILDADRNIVSAPEGQLRRMNGEYDGDVKVGEVTENETFTFLLDGKIHYCRYLLIEGYTVVSFLPEEEALQMRNIALYVNTFMEIIVFAVLFALIYLLIRVVVVKQILSVNSSLGEISGGNLNIVVDVRSNAEFASLSDDINTTVGTLKRYIAEASARIDEDLQLAKNIQSSVLPSKFPAFPKRKDFDIFATMDPAKEVGGDFYDLYITHEDTLHFLIADVSGKGIPAAMFMMRAKTELKSLTEADLPLSEVFTRGNAALCEGNDAGMFVTAWQGGIDLTTGKVSFVNAGHNPPLVKHADGKFEYLRTRCGLILASMDIAKYRVQELDLAPGDIVFLYTDGVTEATDLKNELFGETRLRDALNSREFDSMEDLCRFVKSEVDAFVGDAPQFDDITMLAFRYLGVPTIHIDEARIEDIAEVTQFAEEQLERMDCPMKAMMQINIAIDEIMSNVINHGYSGKPGPVTVQLIEKNDPHMVCVRFSDKGIPYNPLTKADPDVTLSAEERKIGGLGVYLVKKTMDDVKYKYEDGQNVLTIFKRLE